MGQLLIFVFFIFLLIIANLLRKEILFLKTQSLANFQLDHVQMLHLLTLVYSINCTEFVADLLQKEKQL